MNIRKFLDKLLMDTDTNPIQEDQTASPIPQQMEVAPRELTPEPLPVQADHLHQWDIIMKTYAPPVTPRETMTDKLFERSLFGLTTLLFKCVICSETKKEEVLGSDENHLDELLKKVALYGPQYLQQEGVTFVVAKWVPPTQQTNIPLRTI